MVKCMLRDFDAEGRMFFCELEKGHAGDCYREKKSGYRRAHVRVLGRGYTFRQLGLRR